MKEGTMIISGLIFAQKCDSVEEGVSQIFELMKILV